MVTRQLGSVPDKSLLTTSTFVRIDDRGETQNSTAQQIRTCGKVTHADPPIARSHGAEMKSAFTGSRWIILGDLFTTNARSCPYEKHVRVLGTWARSDRANSPVDLRRLRHITRPGHSRPAVLLITSAHKVHWTITTNSYPSNTPQIHQEDIKLGRSLRKRSLDKVVVIIS